MREIKEYVIAQGIFVIPILVYVVMVIGNDLKVFYSWIGALLIGVVVTATTFRKKRIVLGAIDLLFLILLFLHPLLT